MLFRLVDSITPAGLSVPVKKVPRSNYHFFTTITGAVPASVTRLVVFCSAGNYKSVKPTAQEICGLSWQCTRHLLIMLCLLHNGDVLLNGRLFSVDFSENGGEGLFELIEVH